MRRAHGFTLLELVIVLVVIGILASIAYPSYQSYMARSRRADAEQLMMAMHNRQKQLLIEQRAYATAMNALNVATQGWTCTAAACENTFYTISFNPAVDNTATPPSYTIAAAPKAGSAQADDGTLTLTHTGERKRLVGGVDKGW